MNIVENFSVMETKDEKQYKYEYRMIKSDVSLCYGSEKISVQSYGIEVERQDLINGNIINIEREIIKSISPNRYKVHNLIKIISDNIVSPINVIDIIGEYIDDYIIDFDNVYKNTCVM